MPRFLDIHVGIHFDTVEALQAAHQKDVDLQEKHGVKYLKYWYDASTGRIFCLCEAPSKEAAVAVHVEAHGHAPDEIFEVDEFE
jgi:hypothetical protein